MHWLNRQIHRLTELEETYRREKVQAAAKGADLRPSDAARRKLVEAIREVVREIGERPGVLSSFACHEGLLVERAGGERGLEGLAAGTQKVLEAARAASSVLDGVRQVVLVGAERKLALFSLGPMAIGVLSPAGTVLSLVLGREPRTSSPPLPPLPSPATEPRKTEADR